MPANTIDQTHEYSIPEQAQEVFLKGILNNPLITKYLPAEAAKCGATISFEGSSKPCLPINWRFAESVSALKALEATMLAILLARKYNVKPPRVTINTDQSQLFFMSTFFWDIDPEGLHLTPVSHFTPGGLEAFEKMFPSWDKGDAHKKPHRIAATNIYQTKDSRFYHIHGSMNPDSTIESLGLPLQKDVATLAEAYKPYMEAVSQLTAVELDELENSKHRQAGTICWTTEEYSQSEHGKANSSVGLYELHDHPNPAQPPFWWPPSPQTSSKRPLAGLKVVDLTRVIAAPAVTRGLAEMGASVMRITSPNLVDYSNLHLDLNWGKWNSFLELRADEDREKLKALILDADFVVQGYRPAVLDKFGFGMNGILDLCAGRDRGIIILRENCYGWNGPWAGRSGWQQISDACCGISMEFGRAMGNDEPVTPVFPNSDYCTGIIGVVAALDALMRRAEKGGSYCVDISLNYYSQWLVNSCGTYPTEVWEDLWTRNGRQVFRHYHGMSVTLPAFIGLIIRKHSNILLNPEFFEERSCNSIGYKIKTVKPILQYPDGEVELRFNVGTRTNGVDKPYWPEDLLTEIVQ